jgi:hypothetical protein
MKYMLAGFLTPKENSNPNDGASPKDDSAQNPLIVFVPENGKPLEEKVEGTSDTFDLD